MIRLAIVSTGKAKTVAEYLPNNYKVLGRTLDNAGTVIVGIDDHGWTLDDYVIPRLGSALFTCIEVTEIDGLDLLQLKLELPEPAERRRRGRKPALDRDKVEEVRNAWRQNDNEWQEYRKAPHRIPEPHHLTVSDLARRFRVSEGVIADVLNRTGAYRS